MIDYLNELREGCLEAYAGIIQGLKGEGTSNNPAPELTLVHPHVNYIVQFITVVAQDSDHSDGTIAACAGLIGYVIFFIFSQSKINPLRFFSATIL